MLNVNPVCHPETLTCWFWGDNTLYATWTMFQDWIGQPVPEGGVIFSQAQIEGTQRLIAVADYSQLRLVCDSHRLPELAQISNYFTEHGNPVHALFPPVKTEECSTEVATPTLTPELPQESPNSLAVIRDKRNRIRFELFSTEYFLPELEDLGYEHDTEFEVIWTMPGSKAKQISLKMQFQTFETVDSDWFDDNLLMTQAWTQLQNQQSSAKL